MNFTPVIDALFGARDAGYAFDETAPLERDEALYGMLARERGANFVDEKEDGFMDFDSGLFLGEDGNHYAVEFVWIGDEKKPVVWHRLQKEGKE